MKSIFIVLSLFFLGFSSYGQSLEFTDKVLDKMVLDVNLDGSGMVTKEMHQELQLTQDQLRNVEDVNKQRFQQLIKAEEKFAGDTALLKRTFNHINTTSDKALSSVLTEKQLSLYQKLAVKKDVLYSSTNLQD